MNIYDELSIKWDGIKGKINTVYIGHDYEDDYDITYDVELTDIMEDDEIKLFDNFIERAKKEHELLGLYQKRFGFYNFDEDKDLREIKLKEKELKGE